jgi:Ricin-type beta-trefoil lectin domain
MDSKTIRAISCKMMFGAVLVPVPWMVAYGDALPAENGTNSANASFQPLQSSQSAENSGTASAADDKWVPSALFHLHWLGGDHCLDSNSAGQVSLNPCRSYNNFQKWSALYFLIWSGTSTTQTHLQNRATRRCLQAVGAQVYTQPCQAFGSSQSWETLPAGSSVQVKIKNLATGLCLQILQGRVVLGSCNSPEHPIFWVREP